MEINLPYNFLNFCRKYRTKMTLAWNSRLFKDPFQNTHYWLHKQTRNGLDLHKALYAAFPEYRKNKKAITYFRKKLDWLFMWQDINVTKSYGITESMVFWIWIWLDCDACTTFMNCPVLYGYPLLCFCWEVTKAPVLRCSTGYLLLKRKKNCDEVQFVVIE